MHSIYLEANKQLIGGGSYDWLVLPMIITDSEKFKKIQNLKSNYIENRMIGINN